MWIVYIGTTMQSAWDDIIQARNYAEKLRSQGRTGVHIKKAEEFAGLFNNGYIFGYH